MKKVDNQKVFKALKHIEENHKNKKKFIIDFMISKPIKLNFDNECFEVVAGTETEIKYVYNSEKNNND